VHHFVFDEGLEPVENLDEEFDGFVLGEILLLLEVDLQVALIAVL
jgi:hypothetical protein